MRKFLYIPVSLFFLSSEGESYITEQVIPS
jgi:hypothetical protein